MGWFLFYASMVAYFLTPIYGWSTRNNALHAAAHAWFLGIGLCFWLGAIGETPVRRSPGRRIGFLLAGMPIEAALGLALMAWPRPLPRDTLAATHQAGQLFWMASMVISGAALLGLIVQRAASDSRAVRRLERPLSARRPELDRRVRSAGPRPGLPGP